MMSDIVYICGDCKPKNIDIEVLTIGNLFKAPCAICKTKEGQNAVRESKVEWIKMINENYKYGEFDSGE